ncbi:MAG: hypothetical protein HQK87_04070, partial [Nitrospinae bacterium]|nr:hypothetical protein [Nitrospinota bacterium]
MPAFSASELFAFPAHLAILRRIATDLEPLSNEAAATGRAEGVGVWSFLSAVAL